MQYPIRTIATMTGVKPVTLRAWETRYGLLKPVRTDSGHRLYSDGDIETIQKALALRARGVPIRQVPEMLNRPNEADDAWGDYRNRMLEAISNFDEPALDSVYMEVMRLYPISIVIDELIEPTLTTLGLRWDKVPGGIAEEHFFSVYVGHKLEARFQQQFGEATGPLIICACLPNEIHDLGLSLFCLAAHESNYRVINLGANTPLQHLQVACERRQPAAVILAGLQTPADNTLAEIQSLCKASSSPVCVGGQAAIHSIDVIEAQGAVALENRPANALRQLTQLLSTRRTS